MVPHKFARAAPAALLEELVRREQAILDRLWIELHLVARDRVDEWLDHAEERLDQEGDVQDQCRAQAFWVVRLEDIQDLGQGSGEPITTTANEGVLTVFAVENDGFFALSAKLIINTTDLFDREPHVRNALSVGGLTHSTPGPVSSSARSSIQTVNCI